MWVGIFFKRVKVIRLTIFAFTVDLTACSFHCIVKTLAWGTEPPALNSVKISYCRCGLTVIAQQWLFGNIWDWWLSFQCTLSCIGLISENTNTANVTVSSRGRTWDTLEIWWRHDNIFLEHHNETHVLFYAKASRFSKFLTNISVLFVHHSGQSALSLGKFINYECWVEDTARNKDFLLLKFSCFSKYT